MSIYAKAFRLNRKAIVFSTFEQFAQWEKDNEIIMDDHLTPSSYKAHSDITGETFIVSLY